MKRKKKIILELVILITIIASIFVVLYIYKELNDITPKESESNQIENYSEDKYIKTVKNLDDLKHIKIPQKELINNSFSSYYFYIISTDNIINTVIEKISINYNVASLEPEMTLDKDSLINFCNAYNTINTNYKLECVYKENLLSLKNTFYINQIYTEEIKTKNFTIKTPIKKDTKLDEYLESLNKNNIKYDVVKTIE